MSEGRHGCVSEAGKKGVGSRERERMGGKEKRVSLEARPCLLVTVCVFGEGWPDGIAYVPWRDMSGRRLSPPGTLCGGGSGGNPKAGQLCAARTEWHWARVW